MKQKRKSMYGALADENNPIIMDEIVRDLKKDRLDSDDNETRLAMRIETAWKRHDKGKFTKKSFAAFLKELEIW